VVSSYIAVMSAVRHSVERVILNHTYVYIVVSAYSAVMCAVRHSFKTVT